MIPEICQTILEACKTAPDSQISDALRKKCLDFNGGSKELLELFTEIYNSSDADSSRFIRAMVNPKYTAEYIRLEESPVDVEPSPESEE